MMIIYATYSSQNSHCDTSKNSKSGNTLRNDIFCFTYKKLEKEMTGQH